MKVEGPLHVVCQCDKCKAQPAQEPVAWGVDWGKTGEIPCVSIIKLLPNVNVEVVAVEHAPNGYTTPLQRPWVGLTDADWKEIEDRTDTFDQGVAWAQAKLKEKNT